MNTCIGDENTHTGIEMNILIEWIFDTNNYLPVIFFIYLFINIFVFQM